VQKLPSTKKGVNYVAARTRRTTFALATSLPIGWVRGRGILKEETNSFLINSLELGKSRNVKYIRKLARKEILEKFARYCF
jgi:hypothetical protein